MSTAKTRILANYEGEKDTFFYMLQEYARLDTKLFLSFIEDVYDVANEYAGKEWDRKLAVALNHIQYYLVESCMYHAQEADCYEMDGHPGDGSMTVYLDVLKNGITAFFEGKRAGKPMFMNEEKRSNVLIFTTVDKLGYTQDIKIDDEFTEEFKVFIESEYGIKKDQIKHTSIYASEAMNGDELYIEVVSEDEEVVKEMGALIQNANIRTRHELAVWMEEQGFELLAVDADIGQYDEYFVQY